MTYVVVYMDRGQPVSIGPIDTRPQADERAAQKRAQGYPAKVEEWK